MPSIFELALFTTYIAIFAVVCKRSKLKLEETKQDDSETLHFDHSNKDYN
jgi:hypothetical protein